MPDLGPRGTVRLLSLAGGGVRGIFQAQFLHRLEERLGGPLLSHFDAVAATSTGAIVGLAVAAGIPAQRIVELYRSEATGIFRPRLLSAVRRGPRYNVEQLERALTHTFGDRRLGDLPISTFVTSSVMDTHEGRLFTKDDAHVRLVDAALASAGAPTYFPPRRIQNDERSYLDGGLWANDPAFVASHELVHRNGVGFDQLSVLSVGTGRIERGITFEQVASMRPIGLKTLRFILDVVPSLQAWQAQVLLERMLEESQVQVVNPLLREWIPLDAAELALQQLPARAESEFEKAWPKVEKLLNRTISGETPEEMRQRIPAGVVVGVNAANLSTFIPSRKYYGKIRGKASITEYIATARRELVIVSINLTTGDALESMLRTVRTMLARTEEPVRVKISLLDPSEEYAYLVESVAANWDGTAADLKESIEKIVSKLKVFHADLPTGMRSRLNLHLHRTLPSASAILIDPYDADGTVQLETKAYKTPMLESFGFEVTAGSEFYVSLRDAYVALIEDGTQVF